MGGGFSPAAPMQNISFSTVTTWRGELKTTSRSFVCDLKTSGQLNRIAIDAFAIKKK